MKLAVIESRDIHITNMEDYIPASVTEIVSGGARGIDTQAKEYAKLTGVKFTVFLPDDSRYGKAAPLKRNDQIANYADEALAFWDGHSRGTISTIQRFQQIGKTVRIIFLSDIPNG